MLSDAAFNSYVAGVKFYFSMPGMRAAWKLSEGQFGATFATSVMRCWLRPNVRKMPTHICNGENS